MERRDRVFGALIFTGATIAVAGAVAMSSRVNRDHMYATTLKIIASPDANVINTAIRSAEGVDLAFQGESLAFPYRDCPDFSLISARLNTLSRQSELGAEAQTQARRLKEEADQPHQSGHGCAEFPTNEEQKEARRFVVTLRKLRTNTSRRSES